MTVISFVIREALPADIEPMRALERRAAQKFREIGFDFCADGPVRDAEEHRRVLAAGATLLAEGASGPAGFAMFEPLDGDCHLVEIGVDPDHQGHGLARRLIADGEVWAQRNGFDAMTLTTYRDVPWNAPFYSRLGFAAFEPGPERKGLLEAIAREAAWGFAFASRIVMLKRIDR